MDDSSSAKRSPRRLSFEESDASPQRVVRMAASQSFNEEEINWLHQLMSMLLRGGDARVIVRAPVARKLFIKVLSMKQRLDTIRKLRGERE